MYNIVVNKNRGADKPHETEKRINIMKKFQTLVHTMYDTIKEKEEAIRNNIDATGNVYEDLPVFDTIINLYASKEVYAELIDEYRGNSDLYIVLGMYHTFEAQLEGYIEGIKEYASDEVIDEIDELMDLLDDSNYMKGGEYLYETI